MFREAQSAPRVVARQLRENAALVASIGRKLRARKPQFIVTCARGSSDHAATYGKYLIEIFAGVPTASFAPSVSSVYAARQNMQNSIFLALSQSGKSPDLLASASAAKAAGALVIAMVNDVDSPLAALADEVIALRAGPETSVAATKSYIATLAALAQLVAEWTESDVLRKALSELPEQLERAWQLDWQPASNALLDASNLYVIGRGVGLGVAQEAALKFKETTGLHAEAFSATEVRHGPMAIVEKGFPVLIFSQDDETRAGMEALVTEFAGRGAIVLLAGKPSAGAISLASLESVAAATAPIVFIQSFYKMVNALAVARGFDPDHPPHLRKITETV